MQPETAGRSRNKSYFQSIRPQYILIWVLLLVFGFSVFVPDADARRRFEEGDWKAWPDLRYPTAFEVGRNTVYIGTNMGILRWNRVDNEWLYPWFSVPSSLPTEAFFLQNVIQVQEDPLTHDVWVELEDGWLMRDHGFEFWDEVEPPSGSTADRLFQEATPKVKPNSSLISPYLYRVSLEDNSLSFRNEEWDFAGGVTTTWDKDVYAWSGFGTGLLDKYSPTLELYPQGVGPTLGMAITDSTIWAAGELDYDNGWLWKRNRLDGDRWNFFHPSVTFGILPGTVNELQVDSDGTVWIAMDTGVSFGNGNDFRSLRKTDGLPSERVYDIEPFEGGAWIATRFGMALIKKKPFEIIHLDREKYPQITGGMFSQLTSDGDVLYASGVAGLWRHPKGGGWEEIPIETTVGAGAKPLALWAEDGWLAIGNQDGLAWRSPEGEWKQAFASRWDDGYVFAIDFHGGLFWLGTDRGLAFYDPETTKSVVYSTEEGLPGNTVYQVHGEGDTIWFGTDVALGRFLWNVPGRID